jgi:hypothetical protein
MPRENFTNAYLRTLRAAEVEKIRAHVQDGRWIVSIKICGSGWATHDIPLSIVRTGTAEQGEETAQEILQELRCRSQ